MCTYLRIIAWEEFMFKVATKFAYTCLYKLIRQKKSITSSPNLEVSSNVGTTPQGAHHRLKHHPPLPSAPARHLYTHWRF